MLRLYRGTEDYHDSMNSIREFIAFHRLPAALASRLLECHTDTWNRTNGLDMAAGRDKIIIVIISVDE